MFEDVSIMISGKNDSVYLLEIDANVRETIIQSFEEAAKKYLDPANQFYEFDGRYKPDSNEYLYISNYTLCQEIKNAIKNPSSIDGFRKMDGQYPAIKAIFVGSVQEKDGVEEYTIAFQLFKKEQRLVRAGWINLLASRNTFERNDKYGFSISNTIECFYRGTSLYFKSFYLAKQIFPLNDLYRIATFEDVQKFANHPNLYIEDKDSFIQNADQCTRRRISLINDSKILETYSADEISDKASMIGINIEIKDGKLVIPEDKVNRKSVISFLVDEEYKSSFSDDVFRTNSKTKVNTEKSSE